MDEHGIRTALTPSSMITGQIQDEVTHRDLHGHLDQASLPQAVQKVKESRADGGKKKKELSQVRDAEIRMEKKVREAIIKDQAQVQEEALMLT